MSTSPKRRFETLTGPGFKFIVEKISISTKIIYTSTGGIGMIHEHAAVTGQNWSYILKSSFIRRKRSYTYSIRLNPGE